MSDSYDKSSKLNLAGKDLEQAKFLINAIKKIAVRVGNDEDSPLYVSLSDASLEIDFYVYDAVTEVLHNIETKVISYTVPPTKELNISSILVSSNNTAKYTVKINNIINKVKRTYFGSSLNEVFRYNSYKLIAGDKIEIFALHNNNNSTASIEATIEGKIK